MSHLMRKVARARMGHFIAGQISAMPMNRWLAMELKLTRDWAR